MKTNLNDPYGIERKKYNKLKTLQDTTKHEGGIAGLEISRLFGFTNDSSPNNM